MGVAWHAIITSAGGELYDTAGPALHAFFIIFAGPARSRTSERDKEPLACWNAPLVCTHARVNQQRTWMEAAGGCGAHVLKRRGGESCSVADALTQRARWPTKGYQEQTVPAITERGNHPPLQHRLESCARELSLCGGAAPRGHPCTARNVPRSAP
ncbi:hypothetical protein HPB50_023017 [Hyalomma asiaticum]|uniref:Uncharacterized protein n=1 Tax=Hyalomma asiaticum TaxID=266040 RepID=A0ACB7SAZ7_HYAAI|nr:hypothetical protein HPB50_023017 [Hyalomma asiaticum]